MLTKSCGLSKAMAITVAALFLVSCSNNAPPPPLSPLETAVNDYTDAYNAKDITKMAELMHDQIEWINIEGSDQTILTSNKNILIGEMAVYFSTDNPSKSILSDWSVNGNFVTVKESVTTPTEINTTRTQSSNAVYEFEEGLIRRVWYFPAQKHEETPLEVE